MDQAEVTRRVRQAVAEFGELEFDQVDDSTPLIGPGSPVKSRTLVEILLSLEEFAEEELGAEFDWTSDSAMSQNRSMFRSVQALAEHLHALQAS
jgi:acyl carrier protein